MRGSLLRPRSTSFALAPTTSHRRASSLANVTEVARKALIACFDISADSNDIKSRFRQKGESSAMSRGWIAGEPKPARGQAVRNELGEAGLEEWWPAGAEFRHHFGVGIQAHGLEARRGDAGRGHRAQVPKPLDDHLHEGRSSSSQPLAT